ncbi:penicillin-binding protein [Edaphobacillus lindanitolerans]|uniref:serine-type D-Ala-D-Ala carboxypeptidase n=1 Tax=Edaphobacillus lindanitolerans TaxID=550447 RepID=A0A1U7PJ66_9BACI|nr:penicillin-binding protein [Edaphobacillus lindanitolerans]SIT67853.1 penicillin-binding protein 2B [Edaphobacillus lindanitolerans]
MFCVYGGLFFLLFGRFLYIQVTGEVEGRPLAAMAQAKYERENVLSADRGRILDRDGQPIAEDTLSYNLVAILSKKASDGVKDKTKMRHVTDREKTAKALSEHIDLSYEEILELLNRQDNPDVYQVEFGSAGRNLSHEKMNQIKALHLPGIQFVKDKKRFYPNGMFASHLIGFAQKETQKDGTTKTVGQMGLEKTFDEILTGENGKMEYESDTWGFLLPGTEEKVTPAVDGSDIRLTLDKTIQNFVEDAMNRVQKEYSPERMSVIVADPKTGEILAMSQRPSFNPETKEGLSSNWLNEAVQYTIEPGSTMKVFTLASAIEEGVWAPNDHFKSGSYTMHDTTIYDHKRAGWGYISFLEGFQRSSNVSMAYLLERMKDEAFIGHLRDFGFGEKTGIDLPGEAAGVLNDVGPVERLTTSYGQGSTVTPIQMVQAATAIANGGTMMKPYVIEEIRDPNTDKVLRKGEPEEKGKPISAETAKTVLDVMESVVTSEKGTGKIFDLEDYSVAGKTATAQIPNGKGGWLHGTNNLLYGFLGMAPADDPQLIVYVNVHRPKLPPGEYGAIPVSKIFKPVMENSLKHLNIRPDEEKEAKEQITLSDFEGTAADTVIKDLEAKGIKPVVTGGGGEVTGQFPQSGTSILPGGLVILKTEGESVLPDFTGWSKRSVLAFASLSGLTIEVHGEGFAASQSASPGSSPGGGAPTVVKFEKPDRLHATPEEPSDEEEEYPLD